MSEAADWFMLMLERMARMLGAALGRLIGLKQEGRLEEANEFINQYLQSEFDLNISDILKIENDVFINHLKEKKVHFSMLEEFAKLLFESAELQNVEDAKNNLLTKSLYILNFLSENDKTFSVERQKIITKINSQLTTIKK